VPADPSDDAVTQTRVHDSRWDSRPTGYRRYERTVRIGHGDGDWDAASAAVLQWAVKTRSGFDVQPVSGPPDAIAGAHYRLVARIGPLRIREPVRVVDVVREASRCGFAYGTLPGHPVSGEEAFIVQRTEDGDVWLTLRSLTRAAAGWRAALFPAALVAQRIYRRRYLAALRS
jgi:uncharacterized protein (UPF0548 family)